MQIRQKYETPKLTLFGGIEDLTRQRGTSKGGGGTGGGGGPEERPFGS